MKENVLVSGRSRKSLFFWLILVSFAAIAMLTICLSASLSSNVAVAEENASRSQATQVNIGLNVNGSSGGTTTTLDRGTYYNGDKVVLSWTGAVSGNDFVVPASITFGSRTITLGELVDIKSLQTANSEYKRIMKEDVTFTTFDAMKKFVTASHSVSLGTASLSQNVTIEWVKVRPVYRLYNSITSEHLFSTNKSEYDKFVTLRKQNKDFWIGEGIDWLAPVATTGNKTVHRLYNAALGAMTRSSHYYTADTTEMNNLIKNYGWVDDGTSYQFLSGGLTGTTNPIYTAYNEALGSAHHYMASKTEWTGLKQHGWDLEESKNGTNGVFQCIMGTGWSFSNNYYEVVHNLESDSGVYEAYETEFVAAKSGATTAAKAKSYPGFVASTPAQKKVAANNSTVVSINYARESYKLNFDGNGQSVTLDEQTVKFGCKATKPTDPKIDGFIFDGWYYDAEGTQPFDFSIDTMPLGDLTLYAKWTEDKSVIKSKIEYNLDGGLDPEDGNPSFYVEGVGVASFNAPTKANCLFDGWYLEGVKVESISTTQTGDITLVAHWKDAVTVTFDVMGHGEDFSVTIEKDSKIADVPTPAAQEDLEFSGEWYGVKTYKDINKIDFSTRKFSYSTRLYAKWIPKEYWITYSSSITDGNTTERVNYINGDYLGEELPVIKSAAEIRADVEVLKKGESADNPDYAEVKSTYEDYMQEDCYHLYTKIGDGTEKNDYAEFRVIGVGSHDGDESVLTFQATHVLPTAYKINNSATNLNGWKDSQLRKDMQKGGAIANLFKSSKFIDNITQVSKKTDNSSLDDTEGPSITQDLMWIASYSEITGKVVSTYVEHEEGTQYPYFSYDKEIHDDEQINPCLIRKTRANTLASGTNIQPGGGTDTIGHYWLRSRDDSEQSDFIYLSGTGQTSATSNTHANSALAVMPCFAF